MEVQLNQNIDFIKTISIHEETTNITVTIEIPQNHFESCQPLADKINDFLREITPLINAK